MEYFNKWLSNDCTIEDINKYFFGIRDKNNDVNYKLLDVCYGFLNFHFQGELREQILIQCSNRIGIPKDYLRNRVLCEVAFYLYKFKNDTTNSIKLFKKAIKNKSAEALFGMSIIYSEKKKFEKAIKYGEKCSLAHPPMIKLLNSDKLIPNYRVHEAQYHTGHLYLKFKKNQTKCFCFYLLSAENGNIRGAYIISCMYKKGVGCEKDEEKSIEYHSKASNLVKCKF